MSTTPSSADERALFEADHRKRDPLWTSFRKDEHGRYVYAFLETEWQAWQAGRASLGAAQVPAYEEARDAILNERGPLEGMGLSGDQINAVLAILDDSFQTIQGGQ